MNNGLRLWAVMAIAILLSACQQNALDSVAHSRTQDMQTIYQQQMSKTTQTTLNNVRSELPPIAVQAADIPSGNNEVNFYQLANPQVTLWVMPRLVGSDAIAHPGFKTQFQLYEKNEYALPGELRQSTDVAQTL